MKMFKDSNDINEKAVIGFMSFLVMVIFAIADIATGYFGKDLVVNEFIFNSFMILTLGAFGFSSIDKFTNTKKQQDNEE
jgi:ABC-type uncharacterized transport system permease subunit